MSEELFNRHWHHFDVGESLEILESDAQNGLSLLKVERRREEFGPNRLPVARRRGPLRIFFAQFNQALVYILLAAAAVTAGLQEYADSAVIFGVVLVNAVIGYLQESRAEQAMESLRRMVTTRAQVVRDGRTEEASSEDLVPGDVVLLQSGDKVPADLRLLEARELMVDESALTGESVRVSKQSDQLPPDTILADRRNMAFAGTLVASGRARGVVTATGVHTETGRINALTQGAEVLATPLTKRLARFSHLLLIVILILAGLTVVIGWLRGGAPIDMFMAAVALAVGAIPEGLPAALTITLAIGVKRMAARRAIVRRLPAVETLGSTTVICSDKTGTLTKNEMTVTRLLAAGRSCEVTGAGYEPQGEVLCGGARADLAAAPALRELLIAGVLCNESALTRGDDGRTMVNGDPTEAALLVAAAKAGLDAGEIKKSAPRIDIIPFESERQLMATMHEAGPGQPPVFYVKGAVEKVLDKCAFTLDAAGREIEFDREAARSESEAMAAAGLRVLAFSRGVHTRECAYFTHEDLCSLQTFIGFQAMIDPAREEARMAVAACRRAGIKVKMITGDHALTAAAIAADLGLTDGKPEALTGRQLAELTDLELIERAESVAVFARVEPEQKLRLVEALQIKHHVVAMTGDGVNDAPALKRADIGIAMGKGGTEVAKEAADVILTDDNFATIEAAVEEGRRVFDNLTKFISWTLPTNLGEGLVLLAAIIAGVQLPILPIQILWINMTSAVLLGLMLAFEPMEPDVMARPPRDPRASLLSPELLGRIVMVGVILLGFAFGLFYFELQRGTAIEEARTVAVNVFVIIETFYLFNCRSSHPSFLPRGLVKNPFVLAGSGTMILLQLGFTYLPFMNRLFGSAPTGLDSWVVIVAAGAATYLFIEVEKTVRDRLGRKTT